MHKNFDCEALEFSESGWNIAAIQERYRQRVEACLRRGADFASAACINWPAPTCAPVVFASEGSSPEACTKRTERWPAWGRRNITSFDAIVCAGVLQHVGDPVGLLRRARGWLRSGGRLLASIANVRHHSIAGALLDGTWAYEPTGVRQRDHLRSFTRRDIEKLFYRAGLSINEWQGVCGSGYEEWKERGRPGEVRAGRLHVGGMLPEDAEEFYIREYLLSAAAHHNLGTVSMRLGRYSEAVEAWEELLPQATPRQPKPCAKPTRPRRSVSGDITLFPSTVNRRRQVWFRLSRTESIP